MPATPSNPGKLTAGARSFCRHEFEGDPPRCLHCGILQEQAREKVRAEGSRARSRLRSQRTLADLFFLVGLLLGGPVMTFGGEFRLGLLLVLAGGFASVLRRYTEWSNHGTVIIAVLSASMVATAVVGSDAGEDGDSFAGESARIAYVSALFDVTGDVPVQARGPGSVTVWFYPPRVMAGECGEYPPEEIRRHLADLGFVRVVVAVQNQKGGMCSFHP